MLIEAGERVLPGLPERISEAAQKVLDRIGIDVFTDMYITNVTAEGLYLVDRTFIPAELVVWAAGVKAPDVLEHLDGLEVNRINQLVVLPTLQTTQDPDIFAIGDCAACPRPGLSTLVPPRAQAAHQQAAHMLRQIERRFRGEPLAPYTYRDFGSLVSLGNRTTVGDLAGLFGVNLFIEGLLARLMYRSLSLMHERALVGMRRTVLHLVARALARRAGQKVKLH
jgi:NADH dehydrogenase